MKIKKERSQHPEKILEFKKKGGGGADSDCHFETGRCLDML